MPMERVRTSPRSIAHPTGGWNANTDPQDVWSGTLSAGTTGGSSTTPPYVALVFFDAKAGYNPEDFSHVEIMGPDGEMIGTPGIPGKAVFEETLAQREVLTIRTPTSDGGCLMRSRDHRPSEPSSPS